MASTPPLASAVGAEAGATVPVPAEEGVPPPPAAHPPMMRQDSAVAQFAAKHCQWFMRPGWLLTFLSMYAFVQGMVVTGLVSSSQTSIQRRFGLSSTQSGALFAFYDAVILALLIPMAHLGGSPTSHKLRWLGFSLLVLGMGSLFWVLAHVASGMYEPQGGLVGTPLCDAANVERCPDDSSSDSNLYAMFIVGQLLIGAGAAPLYTLGPAALQMSVDKHALPLYLGVFYAFASFGPAAGFVLAGVLLTSWVDGGEAPNGLTDSDTAWVGAYWMGFLLATILAALVSIPLLLMPRFLPGTDAVRAAALKSDEAVTQALPRGSLFQTCKSIVTTPVWLLSTFGSVSESFVVGAVASFLPLLLQQQFALTPSLAALLTGAAVVPGVVGGTLVGGWYVKRKQADALAIMKMVFVVAFVSFCSMFFLFIGCDTADVVGVNQPYVDGSTAAPSLSDSCIGTCSCPIKEAFLPVCGSDGRTYYSACFAGCSVEDSEGEYSSCECFDGAAGTASDSFCDSDCNLLPVYMAVLVFTMFTTFLNSSPAISVVTRILRAEQVALGLALGAILWRLLGSLPGPLVMGALIDDACLLEEDLCNGDTSCVLYDNTDLRLAVAGVAVVAKGLSALFFGLSWWCHRRTAGKAGGGGSGGGTVAQEDVIVIGEEGDKPEAT